LKALCAKKLSRMISVMPHGLRASLVLQNSTQMSHTLAPRKFHTFPLNHQHTVSDSDCTASNTESHCSPKVVTWYESFSQAVLFLRVEIPVRHRISAKYVCHRTFLCRHHALGVDFQPLDVHKPVILGMVFDPCHSLLRRPRRDR
jgi:hypothetical protein